MALPFPVVYSDNNAALPASQLMNKSENERKKFRREFQVPDGDEQ
jgi:hypothetical protein